jgi:FlaG protein
LHSCLRLFACEWCNMEIDRAQLYLVPARAGADVRTKLAEAEAAASPVSRIERPAPLPQTVSPHSPVHDRDVDVQWSGDIMVLRFIDKQSGTLVQQIPSEEVLRVVRNVQELLHRQAATKGMKQ